MDLRFHWMLPKGGETDVRTAQAAARYRLEATHESSPAPKPDMKGWLHFARNAEKAGIDSVLISFSRYEPDPFLVACALARETEHLKYIAAFRAGLMQPATLVQQTNTLSALIGGRISLNIVAGSSRMEQRGYGDFLDHDERYARAEEFLKVCNAHWGDRDEVDFDGKYYRVEGGRLHTPFLSQDRVSPEIYVSGHSEPAQQLAITQGSCWLRVIDTPAALETLVGGVRDQECEVCLRLCVICRPTREEALQAIEDLLEEELIAETVPGIPVRDDSQMYREAAEPSEESPWLSRSLWVGFARHFGPVWTTLIGTPEELAEAFLQYKRIGVSQFILSGWPEVDEMQVFGREVLPLVREAEQRREASGELQEASMRGSL